ncbi:hypothetical protein ABZ517_05665 [Streptomyces scabiei]|uniref:hypothetical protein n=1 Tax=Streptomyces scabiei TaxID=1930 RepID=UPI0033FCE721
MSLEEAMRAAAEFAQNLHAAPLGVRVIGPKGWVSERIGGRQGITLIHNPLADVWTVGCTKCSCTEESTDSYDPVRFARRHQC